MAAQSSLHLYLQVKSFGVTPRAYAAFPRETSRLGALTPEGYLDDYRERLGTKLKCLARVNCLPLFDKISREAAVPTPNLCPRCVNPLPETLTHLFLHCPAYSPLRLKLLTRVQQSITSAQSPLAINLSTLTEENLVCLLLGKRIGDPATERVIDLLVKRFLRKVWRTRCRIVSLTNAELGRHDPTFRFS
jgi:hypothetical protein